MAEDNDVRAELLDVMLDHIEEDRFPSPTMMDIVEKLLIPDDVERYAAVLMAKISEENYPSMSYVRRVLALTDPQGARPLRG